MLLFKHLTILITLLYNFKPLLETWIKGALLKERLTISISENL